MQESAQRTRLYRKAEKMVLKDYPAVFIMHGVAYVLQHDWLENYKPHAFGYGLSKYRSINQKQRRQYDELVESIE
jgi:ABC-type transport system substrate-binding protein